MCRLHQKRNKLHNDSARGLNCEPPLQAAYQSGGDPVDGVGQEDAVRLQQCPWCGGVVSGEFGVG